MNSLAIDLQCERENLQAVEWDAGYWYTAMGKAIPARIADKIAFCREVVAELETRIADQQLVVSWWAD